MSVTINNKHSTPFNIQCVLAGLTVAEPAFKRESTADRGVWSWDTNRKVVFGKGLGLSHNRGLHGVVLMECDISHGILGNCFAT